MKKTSKSALGQDEERPWEQGCHDLSKNRGGEDRDPKKKKITPILSLKRENRKDLIT